MLQADKPLIFISHDTRDAELAEAFELLLLELSAGTLKVFRSSAHTGSASIGFGEDWRKSIIAQLEKAADVVALFTERSIDRPWILYEAGVFHGRTRRSAIGIALGIPFERVNQGPFAAYENCRNEEDALTELVDQLIRRNSPHANPPLENVRKRVRRFRLEVKKILASGSCTYLNEPEFLRHMVDTIPLRNQDECKRRFSESHNPIVKFMVRHHLKSYDNAVNQAFVDQILPLPSAPRMEVAREAIELAKELRAVSIFAKDQWSKYDPSYINANVAAAKRDVKIRRVIILDESKQSSALHKIDFIACQLEAGIELRWGVGNEIKEKFSRAHRKDISLVNILISDHEVDKAGMSPSVLLSRSYGDANHDGEIVLNENKIDQEIEHFKYLWDIVKENHIS